LLAGLGVEVQPVVAVKAAQPQFRVLRLIGHQADGVDLFHRYVGNRQQQLDDLGLVCGRRIASQQQLYIVIIGVADAFDGLADKGFDIGRVLADRCEQCFGSDFFRAFHGNAVAEYRPFDLGLVARVALGQHQAIVEGLLATDPACGPGNFAVAINPVDAHPVVVGDETLVEADVVAVQRRYEHLDLDRVLGAGNEFDLGVDVPEVIRSILGHRYAEGKNLVGRNRNAQHHKDGDQDFQVKGKSAHFNYSAV